MVRSDSYGAVATVEAPAPVVKRDQRYLLAGIAVVAVAAIALVLIASNGSSADNHEENPAELFGPLSFDEVHTHILNMRMRRSQLKEKLKEEELKKRERRLMARVRAARAARAKAALAHSQPPVAPQQQQMYAPPQQSQQMYQQPYQAQQPAAYYPPQQQQPMYQQAAVAPEYAPQPQYYPPQMQQQQQYYAPQQPQMYQQQPVAYQQAPNNNINWANGEQLAQQPASNPNLPQQMQVSSIPRDSGAGQVQERAMAESSERAYEAFVTQEHGGGRPPGVSK